MRPMFGVSAPIHLGCLHQLNNQLQTFVPNTSLTFVSQASLTSGAIATYNLRKRVEPVKNCRNIGKQDMKFNDAMPKMNVDPETYVSSMLPMSWKRTLRSFKGHLIGLDQIANRKSGQ